MSTATASDAPARPRRIFIHRHSGIVRVTHWINAICLLVLLMSGMQIFNAHPALYIGQSSNFAHPVLAMDAMQLANGRTEGVTTVLGHAFNTTGWLGASANPNDDTFGFPWWATLPGYRFLAMGRRWHFFFAWVFVINGLIYLGYSLASGHLRRDLVPGGKEIKGIGHSIADHVRFRFAHGDEARRYNVLQKIAYLVVILVLLPLMIGTGLTMSPGMDAAFPWLLELFGGRQTARTIHFISAFSIVGFVFIHLFMVLVSGVWNNIRSMITGRYAIEEKESQS